MYYKILMYVELILVKLVLLMLEITHALLQIIMELQMHLERLL